MSSSTVTTNRTRKSCAECRRLKVRCIGGMPCRRCTESNRPCEPQAVVVVPLHERLSILEKKFEQVTAFLADNNPSFSIERVTVSRKRKASETLDDDESDGSPTQSTDPILILNDDEEADVTMVDGIRFGRETAIRQTHQPGAHSDLELVAFEIFYRRCAHLIAFIPPRTSPDAIRIQNSGSLLYWAMIAVGSREATELQSLSHYAREKSLQLSRETLFGRRPTMDDLHGLLVIYMWMTEARVPGQAVAVAHELKLSTTCGRLCSMTSLRNDGVQPGEELLNSLRTFGYLFQIDGLHSMVAATPTLLAAGSLADYGGFLLRQNHVRLSDLRLAAQIELVKLISTAQDTISPTAFSASPHQNFPQLDAIAPYSNAIDIWHRRWLKEVNMPRVVDGLTTLQDKDDHKSLSASLLVLTHTTKLHVMSFALRGIKTHEDLMRDPRRLPCVYETVKLARLVCINTITTYTPTSILYASNFMQLQATFSAVLLLRIMRLTEDRYQDDFMDEAVQQTRAVADLFAGIKGKYYSTTINTAISTFQAWRQTRSVPNGVPQAAQDSGTTHGSQSGEDVNSFFDFDAMAGLESGWEFFLNPQATFDNPSFL